jgi:hypothetical protein
MLPEGLTTVPGGKFSENFGLIDSGEAVISDVNTWLEAALRGSVGVGGVTVVTTAGRIAVGGVLWESTAGVSSVWVGVVTLIGFGRGGGVLSVRPAARFSAKLLRRLLPLRMLRLRLPDD